MEDDVYFNDEEVVNDKIVVSKLDVDLYVDWLRGQQCHYDESNLETSADWILNSLTPLMRQRLKSVNVNSGPHYLLVIIKHHQNSLLVIVRNLINQLSALDLKRESKYNVLTFSNKVTASCQRIEQRGRVQAFLTDGASRCDATRERVQGLFSDGIHFI